MELAPNLKIYKNSNQFHDLLKSFNAVQKGHFEYKGKAPDGTRLHGDYFINYRILKSDQEMALAEHYQNVIEEWFDTEKLLIVGVAMGSLILPKVIQLALFPKTGIEYAYTEKREGILGIFGEQSFKCKGKHLLFVEDVCNNGTSTREIIKFLEDHTEELQYQAYSILYGVHRGHEYFEGPTGIFYAMAHLKALSYHHSECPVCKEGKIPLKEYKK